MIENRWKRFAVCQVLSDWAGDMDAADLFDRMVIEDEEGISHLFDECDVSVWNKFEDMPYGWVADHIESIAHAAQEVANYDE
jgi:uncharacterized protein YbdZ (MbtH family)